MQRYGGKSENAVRVIPIPAVLKALILARRENLIDTVYRSPPYVRANSLFISCLQYIQDQYSDVPYRSRIANTAFRLFALRQPF